MSELSPFRKKARLLKARLRGYPVWVSWQVTYACNFRCLGCQYWKEDVNFSREARARESSPEDFRIGAARLGELGSLLINLAGGEPFLRPDLPEVISAVAEQHFPMLTTNGWLVTEENARAVWEAGLWGASVSLDFNDDASHDQQRGTIDGFLHCGCRCESLCEMDTGQKLDVFPRTGDGFRQLGFTHPEADRQTFSRQHIG
jgi:MoaA/NifB/PqqE/SkfB family radical SAM enzyme